MLSSVIVCGVAFVIAIAAYPTFIRRLGRRDVRQHVQSYAPSTHAKKAGTPTMGGALFCAVAAAIWLVVDHSRSGFLAIFALLAGAGLGLMDDLDNVRGRGALGLLGRQKLFVQAVIGVTVGIGLARAGFVEQIVPGKGIVDFGDGVAIIVALAVVATSNAVNLTDGVDGLAGSCTLVALLALWLMAAHMQQVAVAVVCAATIGALAGFLAFNWHPARVFMGDTGSLALGCLLTVAAAEVKMLLLLPLLGLVFVAEVLSVIINVTAIRKFHHRIFRSSPLHHHFEELGVGEGRIVAMFSAIGAAAGLIALLIAITWVHA